MTFNHNEKLTAEVILTEECSVCWDPLRHYELAECVIHLRQTRFN